ncbi:MAG: beta-propeller fold lactonase family protein [Phycisphaeraceae bacterium]|nr:beta-propeller fold lactonase family protein [Phycisphaeraceae bacterium]
MAEKKALLMRKQSWFSKWSRRWGQALSLDGRSTRSRRRALRKISSNHFMQPMEPRILLSAPTLASIADTSVAFTSPVLVGLDGEDADNDNLTYTVTTNDPRVTATLVGGNDGINYNNSLKLDVSYTLNGNVKTGTMVFELFDNLVGDVTARIEQMVNSGYYDGLAFHRVINDFVIQTGSYNFSSGYVAKANSYSVFDDQFHADLLHNSAGLLSMAKPQADDSNSTDFFITDFAGSGTNSESNLRNLDFNHSVFGKIIEGQNVFDDLTQVTTGTVSNLSNAPLTAVTIVDASIVQNTQNGTLILKATQDFTGSVMVTVTASDGTSNSQARSFNVTVTSDNDAGQVVYDADYSDVNNPIFTYPKNVLNSAPYINNFADQVVANGATAFTISGTATDVDGRSLIKLTELLGSQTFIKNDFEDHAVSIIDNGTIPLPLRSDFTNDAAGTVEFNAAVAQYNADWSTLIDLAKFNNDPTLLDLPSGLSYTNTNRITNTTYNSATDILSFDVEITRTDPTLYGTFYILIVQHNFIQSDNLHVISGPAVEYALTGNDSEIVTILLQPPTPTAITLDGISNGVTSDTTPSVTVTGLTDGATLNILDENDNIVATTTVSGTSATLSVSTLTEGSHTLRAVQIINGATSEAASVAVQIDTIAPLAFTDVNLTAATTGIVYVYDVGHPQETDSAITYHLASEPAGMTINSDNAVITWTTPATDSFPQVTFDVIARDAAGNTTTQTVMLTVNSLVEITGVVYQDTNTNSQPDAGEGIQGVVVYVDANGNNQFDEGEVVTTTNSSGSYSLTNVPAGAVILHQVLRDGFSQVTPAAADLTLVQVVTDGQAATLNSAATTIDGLTWAGALAMSPDGLFVYGASGNFGAIGSNSDDAIAVFSRNISDGSLTYIQLVENGINSVAGLNDPNALTVSPDGRHLYVTADDTKSPNDTLVIFSIDPVTGLLTYVQTLTHGLTDSAANPLNNLSGIANVVVSPDDEFVYIASKNSDAVTVMSRNRFSGQLTWLQDIVDATLLNGVTQLTLSPDGKSLYAGGASGLVVYTVDTTTGQLTFAQSVVHDGVNGPFLLDMGQAVVSPDGLKLYAAATTSDTVNFFQRNTTTGALTFVSALAGIDGALGVKINPQGTQLFATSVADDKLRVYDISQSDGSLTLDQTLTHGGTDVLGQTTNGLDGATALLLDPDGNDVYVVSRSSNSVSVYSNRNRPSSGAAWLRNIDPFAPGSLTGINFVNTFAAITVDSVDYNAQQFDSDDPTGKSYHAPTNWRSQRSLIRDITVNFSSQLIGFDVAGVQLARIFDTAGNAVASGGVTLNTSDVIVNGDQLLLRNLDLVDGVYELTLASTFVSALDGGSYSTHFHQLGGDFNGDRVFSLADLGTVIYWRQLASDTNDYVDVPGYLDIRNSSDALMSDGRVDNHDLSAFASVFGQYIPQAAVPVPVVSLSSPPANQSANLLAFVSSPPRTASLTLVPSDDEKTSQSGLLEQLDNTNLILTMIATP